MSTCRTSGHGVLNTHAGHSAEFALGFDWRGFLLTGNKGGGRLSVGRNQLICLGQMVSYAGCYITVAVWMYTHFSSVSEEMAQHMHVQLHAGISVVYVVWKRF
jgi:hypothetical protein